MGIGTQRMRRISGPRVTSIGRMRDLSCVVDDCLIILPAAAASRKRGKITIRIEDALALVIPWIHAAYAGNGIAACLGAQCRRLFLCITDTVGVSSLAA